MINKDELENTIKDKLESYGCPASYLENEIKFWLALLSKGEEEIRADERERILAKIEPQLEGFIQSPKMPDEMSLCLKVWWLALKESNSKGE